MNHGKLSSDAAGGKSSPANFLLDVLTQKYMSAILFISEKLKAIFSQIRKHFDSKILLDERGDVPGWVLVVLMTTGLQMSPTFRGSSGSGLLRESEKSPSCASAALSASRRASSSPIPTCRISFAESERVPLFV